MDGEFCFSTWYVQAMLEMLPPPSTATVREWFVGLALANERLMANFDASQRVSEAIRIADELVKALAPTKLPSQRTMQAPTPDELKHWEERIRHQSRPTVPVMRKVKLVLKETPKPRNFQKTPGSYCIINAREKK